MEDFLFNKPIPFGESYDKDILGKGFKKIFGNDQRNVVFFALGLGIPFIILLLICMFITAWGNTILMIFNIALVLFICWVAWAVFDIYKRTNNTLRKSYEFNKEFEKIKIKIPNIDTNSPEYKEHINNSIEKLKKFYSEDYESTSETSNSIP